MQEPEQIRVDYVVVGAGVAGLRAAIELARGGQVLILAKGKVGESATAVAQGGIAAALSDEDEISLHEQDTVLAGDGLCNPDAVRVLVEEGPHYIQELIGWGTQFDRSGTRLAFTREGAHSRSRILHAHGDSTGWEISRALLAKVSTLDRIRLRPQSFTIAVEAAPDAPAAVLRFVDETSGRVGIVECRAALLATGGLGQIYPKTTNPPSATGDGMAVGFRAGAALADMEFIQFHPTALAAPKAPPFLLSEALRGEGGILRNAMLHRFMPRYHEGAELAPRDVVSRAIVSELKRTRSSHVYLDVTGLNEEYVKKRFPRIYATCLNYGIDITTDMIPVRPAAHYAMGGLKTDLAGRTTLTGLYAAGETASTGVHGANRLASNSLLEGLVFGARAGKAMLEDSPVPRAVATSPTRGRRAAAKQNQRSSAAGATNGPRSVADPKRGAGDAAEPELASIHKILGTRVGILRDGKELAEAIRELDAMRFTTPDAPRRRAWEIHNMWTLARVVARGALAREESRGSHYRADFPYRDDDRFARHSIIAGDEPVRFE